MNHMDTAGRLFRAIESKDTDAVAALYHEDIGVWHNFSNRCQSKAENLETLAGLCAGVSRIEYDVTERIELADGRVLQRHVLKATPEGGETIEIPACIILGIRDGRIIRIDEYLDTGQANRLRAATNRPSLTGATSSS